MIIICGTYRETVFWRCRDRVCLTNSCSSEPCELTSRPASLSVSGQWRALRLQLEVWSSSQFLVLSLFKRRNVFLKGQVIAHHRPRWHAVTVRVSKTSVEHFSVWSFYFILLLNCQSFPAHFEMSLEKFCQLHTNVSRALPVVWWEL